MFDFEAIRTCTTAARDEGIESIAEPSREQNIANHIAANFGCNRDAVRELVALMVDGLPEPTNGSGAGRPKVGAAIFYNGAVYLALAADENGDVRVFSPTNNVTDLVLESEDWAYATDKQIDRLAETFA